MGLLERICEPCRRSKCAELRSRESKLEVFRREAAAANAVYGDGPPEGFRDATDEELKQFGLNRAFMEELKDSSGNTTDFRARMYISKSNPNERLVAFRGTQSWKDIGEDARQATILPSSYYSRAQLIAKSISDSPYADGKSVVFVGHSLGGGLAAAAATASGNPATTFNAAGLNPLTVLRGGVWHLDAPIDAVYVKGDPLTFFQKNLPLPEAAASAEWPLDPPEGLGAALLREIANSGYLTLPKAILRRVADLHRIATVEAAIGNDIQATKQALIENGC